MDSYDAIIAGGGVAGSTAAASLARQGMKVLLCEAGLPNSKRLAGELIHAPGAENLMPHLRRSLVIGEALYTLSDSGVMASELASFSEISWIPFE